MVSGDICVGGGFGLDEEGEREGRERERGGEREIERERGGGEYNLSIP